jgi:hypothetical protein
MRNPAAIRLAVLPAFIVAAAFLPACQSARESRALEKAEVFGTQSNEVQAKVRAGEVEPGFTSDLVYIALGRPDRKEAGPGGAITWTYRNFPVSGASAAATGMNVPGARSQSSGLASANAPGGGGSISSTRPNGVQAGIGNVPDAAVATLVIEFTDERVSAIRFVP